MKRLSVLWTNNKVRSECRIHGESDPMVNTVSFSSQSCTPTSIFIAIQGLHVDGHFYITQAIANGAPVIVHSDPLKEYKKGVVYIAHPNPRRIASLFCHALAGPLPSTIIGVTGTDGKSTTCEFLWQLLQNMKIRCGLLSTISRDDGGGRKESPYRQSTPEAPQLYEFLTTCYQNGLETVILETTSHGLSEEGSRLADLTFAGAIFTTITSEHLEFHKTHTRYIEAKMNLAKQVALDGWIVIPHDFLYRDLILATAHKGTRILTYALDAPAEEVNLKATTAKQSWLSRTIALTPSLFFNIPYGPHYYAHNALGALLATHAVTKKAFEHIIVAKNPLLPVAGRFEVIAEKSPCTIIIDFAHTGDAFEKLFAHVRFFQANKKLIALFGVAGERDRNKRFSMGASAAKWCDAIFLTDEDPRGEPPSQIESDLRQGIEAVPSHPEVFWIPDRTQAIAAALDYCTASDILLLLGKGHEKSIQYANFSLAWNEREIVERLLEQRKDLHA